MPTPPPPPPVQPLPANARLSKLKATAKLIRDLVRAGDQGAIDLVVAHHPRLADLRIGDPRAAGFRLSSAQLTIARHHGFRSWPRLKQHVELRQRLSRSPQGSSDDRVGATTSAGSAPVPPAALADELLRRACLSYGDPTQPLAARDLLHHHPELATVSIHTMAATGATEAVASLLAADPATASVLGGPFDWPPLLYATYSRLPGADTLPVVEVLLAAGADPNAGYLWHGLVPPFTALTGAIGGGERGEPPHPRAVDLARALVAAGADPNDGQAIYNRGLGDMRASSDTGWLAVLLEGGLGRGDGGPWYRLMAPAAATPAEHLAEAFQHACEAGLVERVGLMLHYGADPDGRGTHPAFGGRTAYQGAVLNGNPAVVRLLEEAGANTGSVDLPSRLVGAFLAGDAGEVERLTADAGDLVDRVRQHQPGLVLRAAEIGRSEAVRLLAEQGFDVNGAVDGAGRTPLHEAALHGDDAVVETLLELGADPTIKDCEHDSTPEGWASFAGYTATARLLARAAARWSA